MTKCKDATGPQHIADTLEDDIFDTEAFDNALSLLSPEQVNKYLQDLELQVKSLADCADDDKSLQRQAHKIVSQAGMLGLMRVSNRALLLEDSCRTGRGQAEALESCRAALTIYLCTCCPQISSTRPSPNT